MRGAFTTTSPPGNRLGYALDGIPLGNMAYGSNGCTSAVP